MAHLLLSQRVSGSLCALVASLLVALPLAGVAGCAEPGGPLPANRTEGLYLQLTYSFGNLVMNHYYFTRDGQLTMHTPEGGPDAFNWEQARREKPDITGTYEISGEELVVQLANGDTRTMGFVRRDDGGLDIDGLYAAKVDTFTDNQRLDGKWSWSGSAGGGSGATVSAGHSITLRADGSFEQSGVGGVAIDSADGSSAGGSATSQSSGQYRFWGNNLELKHASGKTTTHTAYPYDMDARVPWVSIDGAMYKPL